MTAIYGFIDSINQSGFLASDNIEYGTNRITDKISIVNNRYALAIYGANIAEQAIQLLRYFDKFDVPDKKEYTIKEIVNKIAEYTNRFVASDMPFYIESVKNGRIQKDIWDMVVEQSIGLVVLDYSEFKMYHANIGKPYKSKGCDSTAVISELEENNLHFYALARLARGVDKEPFIGQGHYEQYLHNCIYQDRLIFPGIGELGARIIITNGGKQYFSSFKNMDEIMISCMAARLDSKIRVEVFDKLQAIKNKEDE